MPVVKEYETENTVRSGWMRDVDEFDDGKPEGFVRIGQPVIGEACDGEADDS